MSETQSRGLMGAEPLRVLCVAASAAATSTIEGAVRGEGDVFVEASGEQDAIEIARSEGPHVAFVDVAARDGAALALVHHLPAVCAGIHVVAMAPPSQIEWGTQALGLGAGSLLLLPPNGDAVLGVLADIRERRAAKRRRSELEAEITRSRRRAELMDRVVRLARGSGHSDAVRAITESLLEISRAKGVAVYATFGHDGDCVRLAAMGSALDLPSVAATSEVVTRVDRMRASLIPLLASQGEIGFIAVDGIEPGQEAEVSSMADLAAAVLSLVDARQSAPHASIKDDRGRVYTSAYFHDVAAREIEKSKRHQRRLALACVIVDRDATARERAEVEDMVLSAVRDTDTFAHVDRHEYFLLMPETNALGAHACRRRVLARAEGDRRTRAMTRSAAPNRPRRSSSGGSSPRLEDAAMAIGISTYPHDGVRLDALLRCARKRASDEIRSSVHALSLSGQTLGEIVDALLSRSMLGAGARTPYPLDLASPAVLALVGAACREARRGGVMSVHVTLQPGLGLATAARQALAPIAPTTSVQVLDVRSTPGCADLEALVVQAEHGVWLCCGRVDKDRFRGVHAADPLLGDLLLQRMVQAGAMRAG